MNWNRYFHEVFEGCERKFLLRKVKKPLLFSLNQWTDVILFMMILFKKNLWGHLSSCWRRIKWKDLPVCDLLEAHPAVLVIFVSQATKRVIEQVLKQVVLLPFTAHLFPIISQRYFFICVGFGTQSPSRIMTQIPLTYYERWSCSFFIYFLSFVVLEAFSLVTVAGTSSS